MKRTERLGYLSLAIAFVAYSVVYWVIPIDNSGSKVLAYVFCLFAAALCALSIRLGLSREGVKSKIYGLPIVKIGAYYLAFQLIVSFVLLLLSRLVGIKMWVMVILSIVPLAAASIGILATDTAREIVEEQDEKQKQNTKAASYFRVSMDGLVSKCQNPETTKLVRKLAEDLKYSDPVSSEATSELETEFKEAIAALRASLIAGDDAKAQETCRKAAMILDERNLVCKGSKK